MTVRTSPLFTSVSSSAMSRFGAAVMLVAPLLAAPLSAGAPPRPRGPAVEVAQTTLGAQEGIDVASTSSGDFVAAWRGEVFSPLLGNPPGAFVRTFEGREGAPITAEIFLDAPAGALAIGVDENKLALIVWEAPDENGIGLRGQFCREDECGEPFQVNTTTGGDQVAPAVAARPGGGALVVWESQGQDSDESRAIVGRFFPEPPGAPGPERIVNDVAAGAQFGARVAFSQQASLFTVLWHGPTQSGNGILARLFSAVDGPFGSDTVIADDNASQGVIGIEKGGDFEHLFAWRGFDGDGTGIIGRRANADLTQASGAFLVNVVQAGDQYQPAIAADANGATFVWLSTVEIPLTAEDASGAGAGDQSPLLGSPIFLKGIKGTGGIGSPLGATGFFSSEFTIAGENGLDVPRISAQPNASFVVSWHQETPDALGVFVRRFGGLIFDDGFDSGGPWAWSGWIGF